MADNFTNHSHYVPKIFLLSIFLMIIIPVLIAGLLCTGKLSCPISWNIISSYWHDISNILPKTSLPDIAYSEGLVSNVIDGDTIEVTFINGDIKKVRYIGIDTPESVDPRHIVECFGREAAAKNRNLVFGKTVYLSKDISQTDKYGRLLRYVYVGKVLVNEILVREGYAVAVTYPPDVRLQPVLSAAEKQARHEKLGLWDSCKQGRTTTSIPRISHDISN